MVLFFHDVNIISHSFLQYFIQQYQNIPSLKCFFFVILDVDYELIRDSVFLSLIDE